MTFSLLVQILVQGSWNPIVLCLKCWNNFVAIFISSNDMRQKGSSFVSSLYLHPLTVSSWLHPGCVLVISAFSVSYQQAYDSYPIICLKNA